MKTLLTILTLTTALICRAVDYETYETNWVHSCYVSGWDGTPLKVEREVIKTNKWGKLLYATNYNSISIGSVGSICVPNSISELPFKVQPSKWFQNEATNIVISQSYTGTFQIGSNFFTLEEFKKQWKEMDGFQRAMERARGRLDAFRDVALNMVRVSPKDTNTIQWAFDEDRKSQQEYLDSIARADQFNKTNKVPMCWMTEEWSKQRRIPKTGIEQGFRSDGVMVWRELPQ